MLKTCLRMCGFKPLPVARQMIIMHTCAQIMGGPEKSSSSPIPHLIRCPEHNKTTGLDNYVVIVRKKSKKATRLLGWTWWLYNSFKKRCLFMIWQHRAFFLNTHFFALSLCPDCDNAFEKVAFPSKEIYLTKEAKRLDQILTSNSSEKSGKLWATFIFNF